MAKQTFAVTYRFVPNIQERREPHRPAHFEYLRQALEAGHLVLAGPLEDPYDGGLLLMEFDDRGQAMTWVSGDPYVKAGLVNELSVRTFTVLVSRYS